MITKYNGSGLRKVQVIQKRIFDLFVSSVGLLFLWWLILIPVILVRLTTGESGFFAQERIGKRGRPFKVLKIRTMVSIDGRGTLVTTSNDPRITSVGKFLRRTKIDELPQLINIFLGQMSFVGPRPDVPGFADLLEGDNKVILELTPGITGPATLAYRNEEALLAKADDPEKYNREIIYPDKVRLNMDYIRNYSFKGDIGYILTTLFD
jgi:lipopolysaccharide/colanic/teichoic acid biosynthesis glycosyltransferase